MKSTFSHLNPDNYKEKEIIWENSIIIPDTNVLLNLYRYPESSKNTMLDILSKLSEKNQIFLLYQVGTEYYKNRLNAISKHSIYCEASYSKIKKLIDELSENNSKNLFIKPNLKDSFKESLKQMKEDIDKEKAKCNKFLKHDTVCEILEKIFLGKVTPKYERIKLKELYCEGEFRYKNKIPPGYEDSDKKQNKYGDFIIWNEILDIAKKENLSFL